MIDLPVTPAQESQQQVHNAQMALLPDESKNILQNLLNDVTSFGTDVANAAGTVTTAVAGAVAYAGGAIATAVSDTFQSIGNYADHGIYENNAQMQQREYVEQVASLEQEIAAMQENFYSETRAETNARMDSILSQAEALGLDVSTVEGEIRGRQGAIDEYRAVQTAAANESSITSPSQLDALVEDLYQQAGGDESGITRESIRNSLNGHILHETNSEGVITGTFIVGEEGLSQTHDGAATFVSLQNENPYNMFLGSQGYMEYNADGTLVAGGVDPRGKYHSGAEGNQTWLLGDDELSVFQSEMDKDYDLNAGMSSLSLDGSRVNPSNMMEMDYLMARTGLGTGYSEDTIAQDVMTGAMVFGGGLRLANILSGSTAGSTVTATYAQNLLSKQTLVNGGIGAATNMGVTAVTSGGNAGWQDYALSGASGFTGGALMSPYSSINMDMKMGDRLLYSGMVGGANNAAYQGLNMALGNQEDFSLPSMVSTALISSLSTGSAFRRGVDNYVKPDSFWMNKGYSGQQTQVLQKIWDTNIKNSYSWSVYMNTDGIVNTVTGAGAVGYSAYKSYKKKSDTIYKKYTDNDWYTYE